MDDVEAGIAAALKGVPHVAPGLIGALSGSVRPAIGAVDGPLLTVRRQALFPVCREVDLVSHGL